MPTISLTQLAKYAFTIAIIILILPLVLSLVSDITNYIQTAINNNINSLSTLNGIDLGYAGRATGLVDFLNNLMQSVLIASSLFISATVAILSLKFIIKFYSVFTKI